MSSSSSHSSSASPPLGVTENGLFVTVPGGVTVCPTTEVREGFDAFKKIFKSSAQPDLLITQDWFTVDARVSETRGWGKPADDYRAWFDRIHPVKKDMWRSWGLRDIIALTTFAIPHNFDILLPLLGFWSSDFKAFIFPWGMVTPNILDVAAITGFPSFGVTVHPSRLPEKINFSHTHAGGVYSKFLTKNTRIEAEITDTKHTTFLIYLFCEFFYGTGSAGIVQKLHPFFALMSSGTVYAWAPFIGGLYKGIQSCLIRSGSTA